MNKPIDHAGSHIATARQRSLGAASERQRIAVALSHLRDVQMSLWLHVALLIGALAIAFAGGTMFANVKRTAWELALAQETRILAEQKLAAADSLLQEIEAIQREQAAPPMRKNRMNPNAGQVSSL